MKMPIVFMTKMAMNESVAATCCYKQVASPTNVYWDLPHAGWVGNGYVDVRARKDPSLKAWEVFGFDLSGLAFTNGKLTTVPPGIATMVDTNGNTTYGVVDSGVAPSGGRQYPTLDEFFAGQSTYSRGSSCDHKVTGSNVCAYYDQSPQYKVGWHFEAKSKHANLDNWALPHEVVQFNS